MYAITPPRIASLLALALAISGAIAGAITDASATEVAQAQTSKARAPWMDSDDIPIADYLALLGHIAPAAEDGAKTYLATFAQRCGRPMSTEELRSAMSQGDGNPVLMGLIRASHLRDTTSRDQFVQQLRCPGKGAR